MTEAARWKEWEHDAAMEYLREKLGSRVWGLSLKEAIILLETELRKKIA